MLHCLPSVRRFLGVALFLCAPGTLGADALRLAAEALERDDFATAIPHLERALGDEPENVSARFNLAYAYQSAGDEAGAIRQYGLIARQQPNLLAARRNLAALLVRAGRFGEAAAEYEAVAAALPDDLSVLGLLAAAHRGSGDAASAAEAYRRLLEQDGGSPDTLLGLAQALEEAGRLGEAVPYYLRAVETDPGLAGLLPGIAIRLDEVGAEEDALALLRRYARDRPDDAAAQEEIGIRLLEADRVAPAVDALQRAVAARPSSERHAALAEAYRRAGEAEGAFEQLRLAARAAPGSAGTRVRYASALLQRREYDAAAREYLAACEADAGHRDAWSGLAFAMFQLGDFAASLRAIREAERLGPPVPASVYLKALGLDRLGLYEPAQAAYQEFLSLRPEMPDEAWKAEQRLKAIAKVLAKR